MTLGEKLKIARNGNASAVFSFLFNMSIIYFTRGIINNGFYS